MLRPMLLRTVVATLLLLVTSANATDQATYESGVVAADHVVASQAGLEMLRLGGNAVDAAVATSFCLSVVRPYSCGIGGGGFMVIHLQDDPRHGSVTIALDYRERCPAGIAPDHFESLPANASRYTGHAVGIPGTVVGLLTALERYGTLDRATVLAPAIRAAEEGFLIDADTVSAIETVLKHINARERPLRGDARFREIYVPTGQVMSGARVRNPGHARALRLIADGGADAFTSGPIADAILATIQDADGVMDATDLTSSVPTWKTPMRLAALDRTFLMMPLPSSGGITILQIMSFLEHHRERLDAAAHNSTAYTHLVVEAMKFAFADRAAWLADDAFVDVPVDMLTSEEYLASRASRFNPEATMPASAYGPEAVIPVDGGTSHFSVVDRHGSAVACTETINLLFGSRIMVPEFGFCLNNEMDDFLTRRGVRNAFGLEQSDRNLPAPGKRPLSSMSPTIVLDASGQVDIVAGASGGPRIISGTLQAILNTLVFDMAPVDAVGAPRFHHQWAPDVLYLESELSEAEMLDLAGNRHPIEAWRPRSLQALGHVLGRKKSVGVVQLIRRVEGGWQAASDPRKGGAPAGQ